MSTGKTMNEQFDAIVAAAGGEDGPLRETTFVISQVWNGGFSQAIGNGYDLAAARNELGRLEQNQDLGAFSSLLELALGFGEEPDQGWDNDDSESNSWYDSLGHLDSVFYAGLDERVVAVLYAEVVKE